MREILEKINKELIILDSCFNTNLNNPASQEEINELVNHFSESVIDELTVLYLWHNGQKRDTPTLFPLEQDDQWEESYQFNSLTDMLNYYNIMNNLVKENGLDSYWCEGADDGVEPVFWSENWIPIGVTCGGDYLCLDQLSKNVITVCHEGGKRRVVSASLTSYLSNFLDNIRKSCSIIKQDDGFRVTYNGLSQIYSNPDNIDIDESVLTYSPRYGFGSFWSIIELIEDE